MMTKIGPKNPPNTNASIPKINTVIPLNFTFDLLDFTVPVAIKISNPITIAIIAIIAIVALFVTGRIGKEKETPFGIQSAAGKAGFGSGFFDRIGKSEKKEESSGPKWKYSD